MTSMIGDHLMSSDLIRDLHPVHQVSQRVALRTASQPHEVDLPPSRPESHEKAVPAPAGRSPFGALPLCSGKRLAAHSLLPYYRCPRRRMEPETPLIEHAFPSGRATELASRWSRLHRSKGSTSSECYNTRNECCGLRRMLTSPAQAAPHEGVRCVRCVPNEEIAMRPGGSDRLSSLQATGDRLLLWSSCRGRSADSGRVGAWRRDNHIRLTRSALHRLERAVTEDRKARAGVEPDA